MQQTSLKEATMSSSPSQPLKFILDENVKKRLERFLKSKTFDTVFVPKGTVNGALAALSLSEGRVLVTNDSDFAKSEKFPKEKIFGVVPLRIAQDEPEALLLAFEHLLASKSALIDFKGVLIILKEADFESFPIPTQSSLRQ